MIIGGAVWADNTTTKSAPRSTGREDDVASDNIELDENDAVANYESLCMGQPLEFSSKTVEQNVTKQPMQDASDPTLDEIHPMSRANEPCDFLPTHGLGLLPPGKFLDTLDTINENFDIPTGGLTGKKALKSFSGIGFSEETDSRTRKSSSRLSREAVRVLKAWLQEHSDHPYPNDREKDELKQRTGLKRTQINDWLANARRRGKATAPPVDHTLMTPLERWKYSPPENEPAATSDILRALVNTSLDSVRQRSSQTGHVSSHSRKAGSSNDSSHANSNAIHTPSISSLETSRSASHSSISDLSFASAFSHRSSLGSFGSMDRKERRRRRRKPSAPTNIFNQQKAQSARIFQCTFCADSFQTKYDWQRHEKSLHLALEKWTCSPFGGVAFIDGANRCVFCMAINPDNDHLESHNYSCCQEKTPTERTFYRKDHLNQHLRLMHNVKFHSSMDKWRSNTCEIRSRCGFCGSILTTWKGRTDHLAAHFKNGADMTQWQGDWGFDPLVQSLVENAMPPYLNGNERNTLDPFTTSQSQGQIPNLDVPDDANCFYRLKRELTAYIHNERALGTIPTDQMLQDRARLIIYGTDDRWNQTCADNPVWLSILKRDTGIEAVPNSEHIQFANLGMRPPFAADGGLRRPPLETNLSARSLRHQRPFSPINFGSGFQSPALPGTGQSSVAASIPGSSAGSYTGSAGMIPPAPQSGLSTDWGSCLSAGPSSFSTPLSGSVDPFIQMGFDPVFLQRLNDNYGELDLEGLQGLDYGGNDGHGGEFEPAEDVGAISTSHVAPISIPSPPKQVEALMTDAVPIQGVAMPEGPHYPGKGEA
ncbi:putative homeobox and C2H2 transcription factor [Aspergillus tanneri]|uniref:Homeobox and C2H2 transcription factor n=1 Tax=Aspergillus tanneri TaxID=1220188 RepID=A0A5M9NAF9_9EURO|nr:uncharacterized protein ATNIH1004_000417 [Aspergillus tanneri]KAA8651527.1 hypothetical protein ATNIH1004_000417 [Aspergillus tanneri]